MMENEKRITEEEIDDAIRKIGLYTIEHAIKNGIFINDSSSMLVKKKEVTRWAMENSGKYGVSKEVLIAIITRRLIEELRRATNEMEKGFQ